MFGKISLLIHYILAFLAGIIFSAVFVHVVNFLKHFLAKTALANNTLFSGIVLANKTLFDRTVAANETIFSKSVIK